MWFKNKKQISLPLYGTKEGLPYINASLDDGTLQFIIDTGSTVNIISEDVVSDFNLPILPLGNKITGISDVGEEMESTSIKLRIGSILYEDTFYVKSNSSFYPPIAGILGIPFLLKSCKLIDFENSRIILLCGISNQDC